MNKLFKFFMFLSIPLLSVFAVSCSDDDGDDPQPATPTITSVSPAEALPGTSVTITGTNLADASVTFGGTAADVSANTATSITTAVPAGLAAGSQNITVTTDAGSDSHDFTVLEETVDPDPTTITSFDPEEGAPGEEITMTGTNFDAENILTILIGEVEVTNFEVVDAETITFTVPEGAETGTVTINLIQGDPVVSESDFIVTGGSSEPTVVDYTVMTRAQGVRNDEGVVTAFNALGETFTLQQGTEEGVGETIDFITADSGGDNGLDLFSPSHTGWLEGNYFEDSDDLPVEWTYRNTTTMMVLEDADEEFFNDATLEMIQELEFDEGAIEDRVELDPEEVGTVILFETERGERGLLLYSATDMAEGKVDEFTFDIKVVVGGE